MDDELKIGARNNSGDKQRIHESKAHAQAILDHMTAMQPEDETQTPKSFDLDETLVLYGAEVKALGGGRVGGYLVRFSGQADPDLTGDYFTVATDFGPHQTTPVLYQHGMDAKMKQRVLGQGKLTKDEVGIWVEAQLEMRDEYEKVIYEMAEAGKLGWSSGTASHLVAREVTGKSNHIKAWPLGLDASLTPTPAEPRNSAVTLKTYINVPAVLQVEGDKTAGAVPVVEPIESETIVLPVEGTKMDIENEVTQLKAAVEKLTGIIEAAPAVKSAPAVTHSPRESASFGKAMKAWLQGDTPAGFARGNEMTMHPESIKGAWEGGTDAEGGYAVPDDFYNSVIEQRDLQSWVRQAPVLRLTTTRDRILIPTESTAGTKLVVTDEEASYDENEPVFGQAALTIYKFTKMLKISEELLDGDAVGLEAYLASTLARAQAKAENYYCTVGTGSSMPQGLVYASTSSAVVMASPDAIVSTDLTGALGTLGAGYWESGAMGLIMAPSVFWYIRGITGNPFQFAEMPQGTGKSLFGYPVYLAPDCDALTVHSGKVVTFANMGFYAFAERQGLTVARNPYLYQANGIVGIFAKSRFGGVLTQALSAVHMLGHND
jgi:HK97 family phage major capsid protein